MKLTDVQQQAIHARMGRIVGAENYAPASGCHPVGQIIRGRELDQLSLDHSDADQSG